MASIETTTRTCDICAWEDEPNGSDVTPHTMTIDKIVREIDLCNPCTVDQTTWLATIGRPVTTNTNPPRNRTTADRRRAAEVRQWAIEQNLLSPVDKRGRLSNDIVKAFNEKAAKNGASA